ncbi:MAG: sterol desaturase family protein, partial [Nannocystaceae bacterium]
MLGGIDILGALSQPLRALVDPQERIFWLFLLSSLAMPWLVLGLRQGTVALRHGLLRREIWTSASSRTDLTFVFVKALVGVVLRVPWLAATAGATLWVALTLDRWLGPASAPGWGRLTIAIVYSLVLFVGWDLSRFALHLAMHRVRVLWAFHQVHHSARTLTPLTLYRTHPVETLLYDLRGLLTTAAITGVFLYLFSGTAQAIELLGINALGFAFNLAGANLRHSHVWLRFGRVERWLLSPAQHQMHHASERALERSNLGTWLAVWDRLAGTWRAAPEHAPDEYGLRVANHRYDRVGSMLFGPLLDVLAGRRTKATALTALAGLWLLPPTAQARSQPEPSDTPPAAEPAPEPEPPPEPEPEPPPEPEPEPPPEPAPEPEPPPEPAPAPELPLTPAELEDPSEAQPTEDAPTDDTDEEEARTVRVGSMFAEDGVARVAGSAHVIDEKELERHEYDDVHKVLTTVPGVYVRQEDGFGLRPNIGFRGANSERSAKIVLLEDGVLLGPAPYSAPAAYFFPLPTRMVGLEVFKGPASIQHGPNTIGGAINLLTRQIPQTHMSEVDLAVGRFGYGKGHAFYGTTYKGFGVLVEAARVQTTGFKELDTGGDTGFAKNDAMLKLGYSTPAGQRISHQVELKAGIASEDSDETYLGLSRADFDATPYRRYAASARDNMSWWRTQAELTYLLRQEELIEIEARVYRHDFERTWSRLGAFQDLTGRFSLSDILAAEPGAGQIALYSAILRGDEDTLPGQSLRLANNGRRYVSQGIQTAFRWMPQWGVVAQRLEVGARLHADSIDRNHTEDAFLMTSGQMVPDGSDRSTTTLNRGEALAAAFHVHDAVTLWDR